jgi:hypothetical protein
MQGGCNVKGKKTAAELLAELRANGAWNAACSYGCHEWVKGDEVWGGRFLKGCRNCEASYFCTPREWADLKPRDAS